MNFDNFIEWKRKRKKKKKTSKKDKRKFDVKKYIVGINYGQWQGGRP